MGIVSSEIQIDATPAVVYALVSDVTYLGRPVARWGYRLSALDGGGILLVESVEDRREKWLQIVSPWITGARERFGLSSRNRLASLQDGT